MSNGNGNGEIQKLIGLRHSYKDDVLQLEANLKTKFEQELSTARKDLKDKYLEKVVDWFYSNGFNGNTQVVPPPTPVTTPTVNMTIQPTPVESSPEAEETPTNEPEDEEAARTEVLSTPVCAECGTELASDAKFCTQCATPVEAQTNPPAPAVAAAGRINNPRQLGYQALSDRRFNEWSRTHRR